MSKDWSHCQERNQIPERLTLENNCILNQNLQFKKIKSKIEHSKLIELQMNLSFLLASHIVNTI